MDSFDRVPEIAVRPGRRTPQLLERFEVFLRQFCRAELLWQRAVVAAQYVQVFGESHQQPQPALCVCDEVRVKRPSRGYVPMNMVREGSTAFHEDLRIQGCCRGANGSV